jgi:hypothetical protein
VILELIEEKIGAPVGIGSRKVYDGKIRNARLFQCNDARSHIVTDGKFPVTK